MNEDLLESSEYYQKRYHNFSTLIIIPIFSLLIFLGFFFIFMKKEITIKSVGTIEPVKIIEKIQSTSDNLVIKNNLEENRSVKKNDVLIEYNSEGEQIQKDTLKKQLTKINDQRKQLEILKHSLNDTTNYFLQADNFGYYQRFIHYLNERKALIIQIGQVDKTNDSQNITKNGTLQILYVNNLSLETQLESLKAQMISEIEQELFTVEQSQLKILGENTFQENLLKKNKIVAKSDGILHIEPNIVKSNIIPKGTPIVKILPEIGKVKKIKIKFYVLSKDISNLEIGDDLKFYIQDSSNKKVELHSKITEIDSSATETKQGNLFKISSEYVINDSMAKNIRYGMSGNIVIITGKKTYLDYYINKLITNT